MTIENKEFFLEAGKRIVKDANAMADWLKNIETMLNDVLDWCETEKDAIKECYIVPVYTHLQIFVTPISDYFDFELSRKMSELDIMLFKKYNFGMVEILQIPWQDKESFFNIEESLLLFPKKETN